MANKEQLSILKQGVEVWNKWRQKNYEINIDLRGADLNSIDLREINLSKADLRDANLARSDLSLADLSVANLCEANLHEADLRNAELTSAKLDNANLNKAILYSSSIYSASLKRAKLRDATLAYAGLKGATLAGADLSGAIMRGATLEGTNFTGAKLIKAILATCWGALACFQGANLTGASLEDGRFLRANFSNADLSGANLRRADFNEAFFTKAILREAYLRDANFRGADLRMAMLNKADLSSAILIQTKVAKANISGSNIYGVSVWDLIGEFKEQKNLIVTPPEMSRISVDNIKVAQFIYLILNNKEIRDVLDTLTSKTVLILGRFSVPERKTILDTLRNRLRDYDLLPIVFDFDRPTNKDFTETIKTLAGLCYFVIADVTNPKSSPLELQATVPDYQIPFVPIIQEGESPFAMMVDLQKKYNWVLNTVTYDSIDTLMKILKPLIIDPAMKKRNELRIIKAQVPEVISGKDFLERGKS